MSNRITTIKSLIVNKVSNLTHIRHCYDYENSQPEGYPFAVVVLEDFSGEFADFSAISKRNLRTWNFAVRIYIERDESSFGSEKAERITMETTQELLQAFDSDLTLGGEVKMVSVVGGNITNTQFGPTTKMISAIVSCVDLVNV